MKEALTRAEAKQKNAAKMDKFARNMRVALANMSQRKEGLMVLRFWLHESNFLTELTYETSEGVNTDMLLSNMAKRRQYLALRKYMDRETIIRIELPNERLNEGGE